MRIRALLHALSDAAAYLDVAVGVVGVHDRQRDRRPRSQGARLDPALGRVHADHPVGVIEPYRGHLGRSVHHDRGQIGESLLLLQQIEIIFGDDCHLAGSLLRGKCFHHNA